MNKEIKEAMEYQLGEKALFPANDRIKTTLAALKTMKKLNIEADTKGIESFSIGIIRKWFKEFKVGKDA
jgi:hypothetical protein